MLYGEAHFSPHHLHYLQKIRPMRSAGGVPISISFEGGSTMKTLRTRALRLRTLALTLAVTLGLAASTQAVVVPGGEILTQTWDNTSEPYVVTGTITVTGDQSLTIGPGVSIEVANGAQIVVQGSLTINGADSAPVWIGAQFGQTWGGVRFMNATGPNFMSYTYILGATAAGVAPPDWNGGGVYIQESDVSFSHVEIDGGNANYRGGGVYITGSTSDVTFTDSQVSNNTSGDNGGGIYVSTARVTFTRCKLVNDRSTGGYGGALHATSGAIVNLTNCTVTKNTGAYASGAIYAQDNAAVTLLNSIVWGNNSGGVASTGSTVTVNYSDIEGAEVWPGTGNILENPWWVNPAGGNFDLMAGSPVIDKGDPTSPYDPDNTIADMGAIYFPQQQQVQEFLQLPTATVPAGTSGDFAITGTVVGNETGTGVKITFTIDPSAVQSVTLVSTPFPSSELNRDGNTIHLSLASQANVTITNGTLATLSFTAPANAVRSTTPLTWVTLTEDPEFGTSINEQPVAVLVPGTVSIPDNPPAWAPEPQNAGVLENGLLEFSIHAQDQDNDPITYSMSGLPEPGQQGPNLDPVTGAFWWVPSYDQAGEYTVTFTATTMPGMPKPSWNGVDVSIQKTVTITVTNVDRPPYWTSEPPVSVSVAEMAQNPLTFPVAAADFDLNEVPVITVMGMPDEATFEGGVFSWVPDFNAEAGSPYTVVFTARSGIDNLTVTAQTVITVTNTNQPPVWTPVNAQSVDEGKTLSFSVSASDADGQALTYTAYNVPNNGSFNPDTRLFSFSPNFDQAGEYTVTFQVTDGEAWVDMPVAITVNPVNRAPEWDPTADQEIAEGSLLSVGVNVNDPDGDQLEVTLVTYPAGATLDGLWFEWTPGYDAAPGEYEVTLRAWDGVAEAFDTFLITVTNTNRAPEWSPVQPQAVAEGQLLEFQVSATDLDGQTLTYSAPDLPSGATFDVPNRTFSWTPNHLQSGFYSVTFYVSDGEATVPQYVQIDVANVSQPPIWGTMPTPAPVGAGLPVTFTVTATDPFNEGVYYGLGESPGSIDAMTGVFTWTPDYHVEGPITIEVTASNRDGTSFANVTVNVYSRYGDATENGTTDAADAAAVLQYSVKLPVQINPILADVTGNEMVTAYDAALILHKLIINPDFRFPVQNYGQIAPKAVSGLPASLVWERVNGGWALRATNTFGLMAGEFTLSLPGGAPVNVTGGDMVAFRQDGENLFVSVIGSNFADGTLFFIQTTDNAQPGILSASLNEGAIPVVAAAPSAFALEQNSPNPFNPSTTIRFALPEASQVNLVVYDVNGRAIRTLASGSFSAGMHSVVWDARDDRGREVATGTYIYRIVTDKGTFVKRMTLLK